MTRISPRHPRYASLRIRDRLAKDMRAGLVAPEGLIAQGRAEAFDYFLGERTLPSAREAIRAAAQWIAAARRPVFSVNGNVASLAADRVARLARVWPPLRVEVNLFHRTEARARRIAGRLRRAGVPRVLGLRPAARIPGLPSDRAWVDAEGIYRADVAVIPLEDGDRAEALRRFGLRVVSIDLNPLSRTSQSADLPIVDELRRALDLLVTELQTWTRRPRPRRFARVAARRWREDALRTMARGLRRTARAGARGLAVDRHRRRLGRRRTRPK